MFDPCDLCLTTLPHTAPTPPPPQPRQWVRFVLLLGDPLVTCLALFGGLLLIGGTLMTSLAYLPTRTALGGPAIADTLQTSRVIGPVLIGLGGESHSGEVYLNKHAYLNAS